jgi:hypothetical protein
MVTCQSHNLKIVGSIPISGKKQSFFIFWNIAKWQGVRFWYEYSKVQILLFQKFILT